MLIKQFNATTTKSLSQPAITKMVKDISTYVDKNSEILMVVDMAHRYSFADYDREVIYKAIGVTEPEVVQAVKESSDIANVNKIQSNPFYASCMMCMHHLIKLNKEKEARLVMTYMSLQMYTSAHKGSYQHEPNAQIMDYTIAHLDNSYIIRRMPSLFAFLEDNATTAFTTYKDRIKTCNDADISWVVDALWTRIKAKVQKIAQSFYKNHKAGNYLNIDSDSIEEGNYHEADSNSLAMQRLIDKVYIRLINRQFDTKYIRYAITSTDVPEQRIANIIEDIIDDDEDPDLKKMVSSLIEYFMYTSGKTIDYIGRGEFISHMMTAYASNSKMEQMIFIKNTLDRWLTENMHKYGKANYGNTVKVQYRKALYKFFVCVINHEAKR